MSNDFDPNCLSPFNSVELNDYQLKEKEKFKVKFQELFDLLGEYGYSLEKNHAIRSLMELSFWTSYHIARYERENKNVSYLKEGESLTNENDNGI